MGPSQESSTKNKKRKQRPSNEEREATTNSPLDLKTSSKDQKKNKNNTKTNAVSSSKPTTENKTNVAQLDNDVSNTKSSKDKKKKKKKMKDTTIVEKVKTVEPADADDDDDDFDMDAMFASAKKKNVKEAADNEAKKARQREFGLLQKEAASESRDASGISKQGASSDDPRPLRFDAKLNMTIYREEDLRMNKGGNSADCPFDCSCCY